MPAGVQNPMVLTGTFDASGNCTIRFQNTNSAALWKVVGVTAGPTTPTINGVRCTLSKMSIQTLDSTSLAGFGAAATGETELRPSEYIDAVFSGGPANGKVQVTYFYEETIL